MNLPAAVITAMALCNQHVEATKGDAPLSMYGGSTVTGYFCADGTVNSCALKKETDVEHKKREDESTKAFFNRAYAWTSPYQQKCQVIQDYVSKFQSSLDKVEADKAAVKAAADKASEQPTLDKGIAALTGISK